MISIAFYLIRSIILIGVILVELVWYSITGDQSEGLTDGWYKQIMSDTKKPSSKGYPKEWKFKPKQDEQPKAKEPAQT
jgi:hypothetical protein